MIKTNLNIDSIENNSIGLEKLSNSIQEQLVKIDEIETQVDENEDVTARALTDIDERIKELYPLKDKVNMFFDENGNVDDTIDSLKEIQHYFDNQGKEVVDLINNVNDLNEKVEEEIGGNKNEIESLKSSIQENEKVISMSLSDLDERIINLSYKLNDKKILPINDNYLDQCIIPNVKYICKIPVDYISFWFMETNELFEEYNIIFKANYDCYLSLPSEISWVNDEYPTIEENKIYELSIVKTKINNISYYKAIMVGFTPIFNGGGGPE